MSKPTVGIWMYENGGGDAIEQKMVRRLKERGIDSITGLNLRQAVGTPEGIFCNGTKMEDLDLFFSYNAGQQTQYQVYLYELLWRHIPTINNFPAFALTEDKFKTNSLLQRAGIHTPNFFLCHRDDGHHLEEKFHEWGGKMVFKPVDGWGGVGMALIRNEESLKTLLPFLNQIDLRFIYIEEFIEYDRTDFRIDIVDGQYVGCYGRKASKHDWRTNVTSGGSVIMREPNDEIVDIAIRVAKAVDIEVCGVDIIYDLRREEYIVLEVNGIPAFATPEQEKLGLDFNDRKIELIVNLIERTVKP